MKRILKNNSIIITALAIMITIVWYLNYSTDKESMVTSNDLGMENVTDEYDYTNKTLTENGLELTDLLELENEASAKKEDAALTVDGLELETAEGYENEDLAEGDQFSDISDEDLALLEENVDETANAEETDLSSMIVTDTGDVVANEDELNSSTPGEAVLASTTLSSGYFASAKLTREQTRARERDSLMEMMENETITEELKQQAVDNYLALNNIIEKENATELLLEAKGFDGAVVTIIDDCVDVVINAPTITEQQIAQIESIVKRKASVEAENIVISAVVLED